MSIINSFIKTHNEAEADKQLNKIYNINQGKLLKKLTTVHIDAESGNIETILKILGIKEDNKFTAISNELMGRLHNVLFSDIDTYIYNEDKSDEFLKQILNVMPDLYGIDLLSIPMRAHCYSKGSIYNKDKIKKLGHMAHYVENIIRKCHQPLIVLLEVAGELKDIESNNIICKSIENCGYKMSIIPISPINFNLGFRQNRVYLVGIHSSLNIKLDYNYQKYKLDRVCDFREMLLPENEVDRRFICTDEYFKYMWEKRDKNNAKRKAENKKPTNNFCINILDRDKTIYPGQFSKYSFTDGKPSAIYTNNIKSRLFPTQARLCCPIEFSRLQGWSDDYFNLLSKICGDRTLYRAFLGGMCYTFLISFMRELLSKIVKFNGKLESENFSNYICGIQNTQQYYMIANSSKHIGNNISISDGLNPICVPLF